MGKIVNLKDFKLSKIKNVKSEKTDNKMFFTMQLYSDEIGALYRLTETWLHKVANSLEEIVLDALKSVLEDMLKDLDYEADYFIETHIYEIDPLIKYIEKGIDDPQTDKKEKIILANVFDRLKETKKLNEYELFKASFLTEHQRYLIMLDDWDKKKN